MTKAVHARRRGDDFQAYCFWRRACHMLMPGSDIAQVGFELSSPYAVFDDVAVLYTKGRPWRGMFVSGEFTQIKYSVTCEKSLTFDALLDPKFINARSMSLLQRLRDGVVAMESAGENHRFALLAPWSIHPDDVLAKLVCREDGGLNMDRLFDGTGPRGEMGALRKRLLDHLGLSQEDKLRWILGQFQIDVSPGIFQRLRENLCVDLRSAGLLPINLSSRTDIYSLLPWQLNQEGTQWCDAETLQAVAEREGLWVGHTDSPGQQRIRLGVRSFMRWAEDMEAISDHMLCLVKHFVGRRISDPQLWHNEVRPAVVEFVGNHIARGSCILLDIQSHCSLAFLLGYLIDPKLAVDAAVLQGNSEWVVRRSSLNTIKPAWSVEEVQLNPRGADIVVGVSISRDVVPAVESYARRYLPSSHSMIIASPIAGSSGHAVQDGTHAVAMAQQLVTSLGRIRTKQRLRGNTHLFLSVPNGFSFFLGQVSRPLGAVQLYEYNFDQPDHGEYWPSLLLDPSVSI